MPTVSIKMSPAEHARLRREAKRRNTTQSAVLREAFDQWKGVPGADNESLAQKAAHLIGSIDGPGDLSEKSKSMQGYGLPDRR